ncbi:MAG: amidohydrolase family protein [Gammaproteobacteria bacterium]|nr:amidohydrolase family protein [Gammaproteobacteria bacterium]
MRPKICVAWILASVLWTLVGCQPVQESGGLVFVGVNIVDVNQGQILADYSVVIEGNRIVEVGPSAQVNPPARVQVVDGSGRYLMPGLWDMHTHLFDVDTPGATEVTFPLLVANGVTGVRDTGAMLDLLLYWRDEVESGRVIGPRIIGTGRLVDGLPVVYPLMSTIVQSPDDGRQLVRSLALRGADFVKAYEMLRPEVFMAIVDEAQRRGLPVAAHVPLMVDAGDASDAGVRSFEHLRNIALACSEDAEALRRSRTELIEDGAGRVGKELRSEIHWLQRPLAIAKYDAERCAALLGRLARNNTFQVPTLFVMTAQTQRPDRVNRIQETFRFVPEVDRVAWEKNSTLVDSYGPETESLRVAYKDWLFDLVRQMRDLDVPLLAGSDISVRWIVPGFSLHEELAILVQAGLTPGEALQTATVNPAKYFGHVDQHGAIRPGLLADLVLLDADPLSDIKNTSRIRAVVADGQYFDRESLDRMLDGIAVAVASGDSDRPMRPNDPTTTEDR